MSITLTPVKSSNIKGLGFDAATSTLAVQFTNGVVWHYAGVPAATFDGMKAADSIGSFFGKNVRGKFEATSKGKAD